MNPPLRLEVRQPVLDFEQMETIRHIDRYTHGKFRSCELDITYPLAWGKRRRSRPGSRACARRPKTRCARATASSIISDRKVDRDHVAIPALLASVRGPPASGHKGLRTSTGLVVETGSAREVHHFALLGGYGAEAVHPVSRARLAARISEQGLLRDIDGKKAIKNFVKAIGKGLRKVMSKMGISTYMSYTGAQIFEAVGLSRALIDKYFTAPPRTSKASACSKSPKKRCASTRRVQQRPGARDASMPAANTPFACAAKTTCGRRTRSPSCSTRRANSFEHL